MRSRSSASFLRAFNEFSAVLPYMRVNRGEREKVTGEKITGFPRFSGESRVARVHLNPASGEIHSKESRDMEAITGVFETRAAAEQAYQKLHKSGIPADKITLLTPGSADQIGKELKQVPIEST